MKKRGTKPKSSPEEVLSDDVKSAILAESLKILRNDGLQGLSIRKVAQNLGISHGAPYRHYATREHILAALTERAFTLFAERLKQNLSPLYETEKLTERLLMMCDNYYAFVFENPDYYRFMFGPPLVDHGGHPSLQTKADEAFAILVEQIAAMIYAKLAQPSDALAVSMFVFSTMHGSASLMLNGATEHLIGNKGAREKLAKFMQMKIMEAIATGPPRRVISS